VAASTSSERCFSGTGRTLDDRRKQLSPELWKALLICSDSSLCHEQLPVVSQFSLQWTLWCSGTRAPWSAQQLTGWPTNYALTNKLSLLPRSKMRQLILLIRDNAVKQLISKLLTHDRPRSVYDKYNEQRQNWNSEQERRCITVSRPLPFNRSRTISIR